MSLPREQVVHPIENGRFVAKAFGEEREKSESLREELREARNSKPPRR